MFFEDFFKCTFDWSDSNYAWDGEKLTIDSPGLDDIVAEIEGERLVLHLKRAKKDTNIRYFTLPKDIDREKISVSYKRGVIEVSLPKKTPEKRDGPISIPVKFSD